MIQLLVAPALGFPAEQRGLHLFSVGWLIGKRLSQLQMSNPKRVDFSSSIVSTTLTRHRIGFPFQSFQQASNRNKYIYRTAVTRGPTHRGKAVIQYRDPSDEFGPGTPGDRRFRERHGKTEAETEHAPSVNLKGWDVHSYRGWDAVDDSEIEPSLKKKALSKNQPRAPSYPSTTSQLTREVIYDGSTTLQEMEKKARKKKARREAQSKPLHPLCRTCISCKRPFKGNGSMLMHLMNAPKCYDKLTPELKMALFDLKEAKHGRSLDAKLRKNGAVDLVIDRDDDDDDDITEIDTLAESTATIAENDSAEGKEREDLKKSDAS